MGMNTTPAKLLVVAWVGCLAAVSAWAGAQSDRVSKGVLIPSILLIAPIESTPLDGQIRASQSRLSRTAMRGPELEKLGWLFIAKARASSDPGYNTLAAVAADTLERDFELPHAAWLLRGHVMQTRHRFAEAEDLGRRLVAVRGAPADFALLGDALYDRGRINEAARAYQQMMDLKPSLDSYTRAANIRWIKGDLAGAIELQTLAVRSGGPRDAGSLAWSLVRLAHFVWQDGNGSHADALAGRALALVPDFQPALLLQGRILLSSGAALAALAPLARAAELLPEPESLWVYAEALRAAGRADEATAVETRLIREGAAEDPRTVAVFLATHGRNPELALQLATGEFNDRADVMTHAACGLVLAGAGRIEEAATHGRASLSEGTVDARLLLHAARIAALAGQPEARGLADRAGRLSALLLPSERKLLEATLVLLPAGSRPPGDTHETTPQKTS